MDLDYFKAHGSKLTILSAVLVGVVPDVLARGKGVAIIFLFVLSVIINLYLSGWRLPAVVYCAWTGAEDVPQEGLLPWVRIASGLSALAIAALIVLSGAGRRPLYQSSLTLATLGVATAIVYQLVGSFYDVLNDEVKATAPRMSHRREALAPWDLEQPLPRGLHRHA